MRRTGAIFLLLALILGLAGCSAPSQAADTGRLQIVASSFPVYDFARTLAGDRADIRLLLKPGQEVHAYDPTPQDIIAMETCDLFLYGGGESDAWIADLLEAGDIQGETFRMMDWTDLLEEEELEGADHDHDHDHEAAAYDEHVWTSPVNVMAIVEGLCQSLCRIDPAGAGQYQANTAAYLEQLSALDTTFREIVATAKRQVVVFGDRFPFLYFAREYGLRYQAAFPGCSAQTEPSFQTVSRLVDYVRADQIPVVFQVELSNGQIAQAIAEETGAQVLTFHSCHNLTAEEFSQGETYLSLMAQNAENLRKALNG